MDFPTTAVLDDFDRADGAPGANWDDEILTSAFTMSIASSELTRSAANFESNYWIAESFPADQEVYATLPVPGFGAAFAVWGRISSPGGAGLDGYWASLDAATCYITRTVDGTHTVLGSGIAVAFAAGDALGLSMIGSVITAYRKPSGGVWAEIGSRVDGNVPGGGYIGVYKNAATGSFDDFGGGAAVIPPPPTVYDYSRFPKHKLRTAA